MHHPDDLIRLFNKCFADSYHTKLAYGEDEPLYLPANSPSGYHTVFFAHGFFSSALHESAHWLIAGKARRALEDYGYWYVPDGRNNEQQMLFQQVEVKPQALECLLSQAAKYRFQLSFDNLNGASGDYDAFKAAVMAQVAIYQQQGLPPRAQQFYHALLGYYQCLEIA